NTHFLRDAGRYVGSLANVPVLDLQTSWPGGLTNIALAAALIGGAGAAVVLGRGRSETDSQARVPTARVIAFAIVATLPPLLFTAGLVQQWAPYYAVLMTLGTSLLAAAALVNLDRILTTFLVVAYLLIGVWTRGMPVGPA